MPGPATIDGYLQTQPPDRRAVLERVRAAIRRGLGECEEVISYQIPAFRVAGRVTIYFAGWAEHFAIYPLTPGVLERLGPELEPYEQSGRGTVRFPYAGRLPLGLIRRIAALRAAESREATLRRAARPAKATKAARGATKKAASLAVKKAAPAREPTSRTTRSAKRARRGSPGGR